MGIIIKDLNRPLYSLTVGEFWDLISSATHREKEAETAPKNGKTYVYGIDGIAKLFGCSKTTAGIIKASGVIDEAISQVGRKITVDADLALKLLKTNKKK